MEVKFENHRSKYQILPIIIMLGVILFLSGCIETKENTKNTKLYQNLNVGETAILSYDNTKLAVTVKSATIENPIQKSPWVSNEIRESNNIKVAIEIKNIGNSGSQTPSNMNFYARGIDYAGFSYETVNTAIPWGLYPGDVTTGEIQLFNVPEKGLKGLKFVYACGEEASWVIFP